MVGRFFVFSFILITMVSSLTMCSEPKGARRAPTAQELQQLADKNKPGSKGQNAKPGKVVFEVGQVWRYKTRPQDPASTFIITKIDKLKGHKIVHVFVTDVIVVDATHPKGYATFISRVPMDEKQLTKDAVSIVRSKVALPEHALDGYDEWRKEYMAGDAGEYTQPLSTFVGFVDQQMSKHPMP
ncbi:MAG TPA: hypothetical protein V6D22_06220 [Candidatus Obscuribacterales bacterium]